MKITVIAIGKIKEKFYKDAIAEYSKRLSRYCKLEIIEVLDEKTPDGISAREENNIKDKEAQKVLNFLKNDSYKIALDIKGNNYDSIGMSRKIHQLGVDSIGQITFIIGGSLGLSDKVLDIVNEKISFSNMTFPHQLMRVILLEQIYRSFKIISKEPYHK